MPKQTTEYLLDTGTGPAREQLACLSELFDATSVAELDAIGVQDGQRCLDVGAGNGSLTRAMADRVVPHGTVTAIDVDTSYVEPGPATEVLRHDISEGVPGGPYDVIHARLVCMHLTRRREIVAELIDALAPGGWLILGELSGPPLTVVSAPEPADAELFARVQETTCGTIGTRGGISYTWAREMDTYIAEAGLGSVHAHRRAQTAAGGGAAGRLHRNYCIQMDEHLRAHGLSAAELDRYRALVMDPRFNAWFYEFSSVRGQKPPR